MNLNIYVLVISLGCICCLAQDTCRSQTTCNDCIQQADCLWCITKNISTTHCLPLNEETKCEGYQKENPKSHIHINEDAQSLSLISPTEINMKIRAKKVLKLKFNFTQPKDFPLDLYFLMDVSYTMKQHRESLSMLASEIAVLLKNYTSDIRMGFGSFVDKPISPFAYQKNGILTNPCSSINEDCSLPYIFRNHLSLTNDIIQFSYEVNTTVPSGNIDMPEGSLEALMQAIVCKDEIGWRDNARKLIILSTDAIFHIAGDGKLAGIDKPNDGLCHLKNNGYTHSLEQDYPSVGQIAEKIRENNVILILAVTQPVRNFYEQFKIRIPTSYIGILSTRSSIVNILENIFENITNTVKIEHNFGKEFAIDYVSQCEKYNRKNATCPFVKPGDTISFTAKLELINCPEHNNIKTYKIYPSGLNAYISVNVEYLCQCSCEKTGQEFSQLCGGIGEFQCGICKCPSDKIGMSCECDISPELKTNLNLDETNCIKENTTEICSGAGICTCGQCVCDKNTETREEIYGRYCDCNDNLCYDENNVICSNHGECECGICMCHSGWSGQKCECSESTDTCKKTNSIEICSNNGNCRCGKCECNVIKGYKFMGDFCETCFNCPKCSDYRNVVECKQFKEGLYDPTQCEENCQNMTIEAIEDIEKIDEGESCSFRDDKNCVIKYKYTFDVEKNTTKLQVQHEKQECVQAADIAVWAGVPLLSILAATLIGLLIFKLVSYYQYKQEYAKFIQECGLETKESNPLYRSPQSRIENPLYGHNLN